MGRELQGLGQVGVGDSSLQVRASLRVRAAVTLHQALSATPYDLPEGRLGQRRALDKDKTLAKALLSAARTQHFTFISSLIHTVTHKLPFTPVLQMKKETTER